MALNVSSMNMNDVKEIYDLTEEDFEKSPYWMFYSGKDSEYDPFVTLIPQTHEDYDSSSVRLIKGKYVLNNGKELNGFMYEDTTHEDHTLFYGKNVISTWYGIKEPSDEELGAIYSYINFQPESVFPIKYSTINQEYDGSIEGFGFMEGSVVKYKK